MGRLIIPTWTVHRDHLGRTFTLSRLWGSDHIWLHDGHFGIWVSDRPAIMDAKYGWINHDYPEK